MTRRNFVQIAAPVFLGATAAPAAPCQSTLDPTTNADYEAYLKTARPLAERPIGRVLDRVPEDQRSAALGVLANNQPYVWNLNANQLHGALAVYKGVVVDWVGAIRIRGISAETFFSVLQRYDEYKKWYKPYIFDCYARPIEGPGVKDFLVTSIVHDVYEKPGPMVPDQHFSFEITAEANFLWAGSGEGKTALIRTHATKIREANSGHPEHADSRKENDLLPPGHGQGVLWRSDTWWRAIQEGPDLYAEYQSLSLARSLEAVEVFSLCSVLRLPGLKGKALESMTVRPRNTVMAVVKDTKAACEKNG